MTPLGVGPEVEEPECRWCASLNHESADCPDREPDPDEDPRDRDIEAAWEEER
jgi:hypothetical protein